MIIRPNSSAFLKVLTIIFVGISLCLISLIIYLFHFPSESNSPLPRSIEFPQDADPDTPSLKHFNNQHQQQQFHQQQFQKEQQQQ